MTTYTAIEAFVKNGKIYPQDPSMIPDEGRLLLIILEEKKTKADPKKIEHLLGSLKTDMDAVKWQKLIRSEWDDRTCKL